MEVTASDDVASFDIRWANATPSLVALSLTFKVDDGEYSMPYYPNPPHVEATKEGKNYTVKGTPPVLAPGDSATSKSASRDTRHLPVSAGVTPATGADL